MRLLRSNREFSLHNLTVKGQSNLTLTQSEFTYDNDEAALAKELTLQVRKVIGPFAAPKKIFIVNDLPKTRSGKVCSVFSASAFAGDVCVWCLVLTDAR